MRLLAGASGYSYKEWKGNFYPADIKPDAMLAWYGERLPSVEINNTFYRMPKANVLESWAASTPASFRFAIKASRRITPMAPATTRDGPPMSRFSSQETRGHAPPPAARAFPATHGRNS